MTEAEKAADEYERTITYAMRMDLPRIVVRDAFEAGTVWQREQDAKLVEGIKSQEAIVYTAARIRAQHNKQETPVPTLALAELTTPLSVYGGMTGLEFCQKHGPNALLGVLQRVHGWYPNVISNQETSLSEGYQKELKGTLSPEEFKRRQLGEFEHDGCAHDKGSIRKGPEGTKCLACALKFSEEDSPLADPGAPPQDTL